jgi:lipopolysaccharide export system permease protein
MSRATINRYLVRELLAPICLCLLIFTLVLMVGRLVQLADLVINKGIDLASIMTLFATLLLPFLAVALPLAFLMGSMIGLGRLCADNETIALRAAGVGLFDMARPILALALGCALLTALVSMWGSPWGKRAFKATLFELSRSKASVSLEQHLFIKQFKNLVVYANHLDERTGEMTGVFIVESQEKREPLTIVAESGRLVSDQQEDALTLRLQNGAVHRKDTATTKKDTYQVIRFNNYDIRPDLSAVMATPKFAKRTKPGELTFSDLWQATEDKGERGRAAHAELHRRLCAPLAPLLFALFILPFGMQSQRSGRSGGFIAGLLIYLAYYLLTSLAEVVTTELHTPPLLSYWTLHLTFLGAGLTLLRQSALERPNRLLAWVDSGILLARRLGRRHAHD